MIKSSSAASAPKALAQLRDIHLPPPIDWWPLAPGWYLLIALLVIGVFSGLFWVYRWYRNGRAKRRALHLLKLYHEAWRQKTPCTIICAQVSELLKRVALVYFPRTHTAQLQGEAWIAFLTQTGKQLEFDRVRALLIELPYQPPGNTQADLTVLFELAKAWIKQRSKPCLN